MRLVLSALVCCVITLPAAANMVQNGSFENGLPGSFSFAGLDGGDSTSITNWTVVPSSGAHVIDYIGTLWTASDGTHSLDLNGLAASGGVEQVLTTVVGQTYRVTFDMAGNPGHHLGYGAGPDIMTMDVSAIGTGTQTQGFVFDASSATFASMGWTSKEFLFTADTTSTTLKFLSTTSNSGNAGFGPALDNVSVTPVPVPAAFLLAMLGLGTAGLKLRKRV